ncbi:Nucleotidyltransferase [Testicularia cyperi]|uniref:DNA polymerase n=1 Tax=Testicularia cyperi TaxID=1882483 RepID=A0A317XY85_9BASI|nr:Nucleotidyltransferase [Testicularia cyperi]
MNTLSPILKATTFPFFPGADEFVGLLTHTASLPFVVAVLPGLKKAYRFSQRNAESPAPFSSSASDSLQSTRAAEGIRKESAYRDLLENHKEVLDRPFPMAAVLDDLRNLQARRGNPGSHDYKVAERRLFRVAHEAEGQGDARETLTVREVTSLLQPDDSVGWNTIRQRLLFDRIDEIDNLSAQDRARMLFRRVYGIGATKAERFVQAGFLTLDDLHNAPLEKAQRIGLNHMDDIESLIPRSESERWYSELLDVFKSVDPSIGAELLGSFRRGDYFSSDLDWVLYHPDVVDMRVPRQDGSGRFDPNPRAKAILEAVIVKLGERNLLADELLAHGPLAAKGLVRLNVPGARARRIDLNFAPYRRRAFYTLAKTGDTDLMVHLRCKAKARGLALNEYGIGPHNQNGSAWTKSLLDATEERQIFEYLKVPYLEPEERNIATYKARLNIIR